MPYLIRIEGAKGGTRVETSREAFEKATYWASKKPVVVTDLETGRPVTLEELALRSLAGDRA